MVQDRQAGLNVISDAEINQVLSNAFYPSLGESLGGTNTNGSEAADRNTVITHYLNDNRYLLVPHRIYISGNVLRPLHLSLQDNMLPVTSLNLFSTTVANHRAEQTE
jgi:hypothetical protein